MLWVLVSASADIASTPKPFDATWDSKSAALTKKLGIGREPSRSARSRAPARRPPCRDKAAAPVLRFRRAARTAPCCRPAGTRRRCRRPNSTPPTANPQSPCRVETRRQVQLPRRPTCSLSLSCSFLPMKFLRATGWHRRQAGPIGKSGNEWVWTILWRRLTRPRGAEKCGVSARRANRLRFQAHSPTKIRHDGIFVVRRRLRQSCPACEQELAGPDF